MQFIYNDGGRAAAGYRGSTGDCVTRAIAIATGKPYQEVYDALTELGKRERVTKRKRSKSHARTGVHKRTYHRYLESLGWQWTPTMFIGSGCKVHLVDGELPPGRLIVSVSKHLTTVIDGVIFDTHDPSADRGTTVYSPNFPLDQIPKGAYRLDNGNGWGYNPKRCVYGYFSQSQPLLRQ